MLMSTPSVVFNQLLLGSCEEAHCWVWAYNTPEYHDCYHFRCCSLLLTCSEQPGSGSGYKFGTRPVPEQTRPPVQWGTGQ